LSINCNFFSVSAESLDNFIKTVVREHHWSPDIIDDLYIDDKDHYGVEYWYNDVNEVITEMKSKTT
jgi:hypothetical protein